MIRSEGGLIASGVLNTLAKDIDLTQGLTYGNVMPICRWEDRDLGDQHIYSLSADQEKK